jgi:hypothetical protein
MMVAILGVLVTLLATSGVVKFIIEPWWMEWSLRRQFASHLWLSCVELREHFEEINKRVREPNDQGKRTREALRKIPGWDYQGKAPWFVQTGYFSMITAYKISAFSSWLRIYQGSLLHYSFLKRTRKFLRELLELSNKFKKTLSTDTILWFYYFDAIGDKIIRGEDGTKAPMAFNDFCKSYYVDQEFLGFFEQLHMFIHFLGREEQQWTDHYRDKLPLLIDHLKAIETFLDKENLLKGLVIEKGRTIHSTLRPEPHKLP